MGLDFFADFFFDYENDKENKVRMTYDDGIMMAHKYKSGVVESKYLLDNYKGEITQFCASSRVIVYMWSSYSFGGPKIDVYRTLEIKMV